MISQTLSRYPCYDALAVQRANRTLDPRASQRFQVCPANIALRSFSAMHTPRDTLTARFMFGRRCAFIAVSNSLRRGASALLACSVARFRAFDPQKAQCVRIRSEYIALRCIFSPRFTAALSRSTSCHAGCLPRFAATSTFVDVYTVLRGLYVVRFILWTVSGPVSIAVAYEYAMLPPPFRGGRGGGLLRPLRQPRRMDS